MRNSDPIQDRFGVKSRIRLFGAYVSFRQLRTSRAFTGTKPLDGFVPCPCGWSGLEHYTPAFHVESYGGKKLTR